MEKGQKKSIRDVVGENGIVKGIWTWSRGGGWAGPYINGAGYPNGNMDDPYHDCTDGSIAVPNGSEMWNDLNAYVVTGWAKNTDTDDKSLVLGYAEKILGMRRPEDREIFYRICTASERAVLLGRARGSDKYELDFWWFRDEGVYPDNFWDNIKSACANGTSEKAMLADRTESVRLWNEMAENAEALGDYLYNVLLPDSKTSVKRYIIMTVNYGGYLLKSLRSFTSRLFHMSRETAVQRRPP